mgnify:CR=1 FL=1
MFILNFEDLAQLLAKNSSRSLTQCLLSRSFLGPGEGARWAEGGGDRGRLGAPTAAASALALAAVTQALVSEGSHGRPSGQGPGPGRGKYRTVSQIPQFTLNFVEFNL